MVDDGGARDIGFLEAAELFKAAQEEESAGLNDAHYRQVAAAQTKFDRDITAMMDDNTSTASDRDTPTDAARSLLKK